MPMTGKSTPSFSFETRFCCNTSHLCWLIVMLLCFCSAGKSEDVKEETESKTEGGEDKEDGKV